MKHRTYLVTGPHGTDVRCSCGSLAFAVEAFNKQVLGAHVGHPLNPYRRPLLHNGRKGRG